MCVLVPSQSCGSVCAPYAQSAENAGYSEPEGFSSIIALPIVTQTLSAFLGIDKEIRGLCSYLVW